jgi:uncharacterized phiE125 gp8 family phage protein
MRHIAAKQKARSHMPSILLTPPAIEPLTLADAKAHLRVEHNDEDALIGALIKAARVHVEAATRRALITQRWRLVRDVWPNDGRLTITPAPLQQVVAARVYNGNVGAQALDTAAFIVDRAASVLTLMPGAVIAPGRSAAGIEIDFDSGYGDAAADVPESLRQAMRLLLTHWYENRGIATAGGETAISPAAVSALIAPYRVLAL